MWLKTFYNKSPNNLNKAVFPFTVVKCRKQPSKLSHLHVLILR